MVPRSTVVTAAIAAVMALTATGSTFTSAATTEPVQADPDVRQAAAPASAPNSGGGARKRNQGRGDESRGSNESRGSEGRGNGEGRGNDESRGDGEGRGNDESGGNGRGRGYGERRGDDEGRIHFNERTYSAYPGGCVTAASGLGSTSFNIFNDSRRTVEVFRGATCDNGGPVAIVGPYGATAGVFVNNGVGGSFRVIEYDFEDE
ncbi:hypothetical protein [Streptomyces sp. NPDC002785]|uniref:hypothetical protein n=1 Tax=Streptomyces sp. NPDC002785 TaxID=3154543 RepID=UPI00332F23DB